MKAVDLQHNTSSDGSVHTPNNLPMPISSFIGRQTEMADLLPLLESNRLVTLTGAGGTGKTRLARQVAEASLRQFRDGVWLVLLSPLRNPMLIPEAVAAAVGIRPRAEQPLMSALTEYFRPRHTLLMLDNCEHLIDSVAEVTEELLQSAPGLKILATSRERLNIDGEAVWLVPPLDTPNLNCSLMFQELVRFDGVQFFAERARAVRPGFSLTEETAPVIAQIASRLDGIPLALELAAACVRSLSVNQIADRLANRFQLLVDGRRTAPVRQATLRQAIDWTHDLLADAEQRLWYRLTVFPADFSLDEAEQVCAGDNISAGQIGRLIARLVDKSVLVAEENHGLVRYRMLETIRQYGAERLQESGQEEYWRDRHLEGYVLLAETATRSLHKQDRPRWLHVVDQYHDNLRAALTWAVTGAKVETGVRLQAVMGEFWLVRRHISEGLHWSHSLLALLDADSPHRPEVLNRAAIFAREAGDFAAADAFLRQLLDHGRQTGDVGATAGALNQLAIIARHQGRLDAAIDLLQESYSITVEAGISQRAGAILGNLGMVAMDKGDYAAAWTYFSEALVSSQAHGDRVATLKTHISLGLAAFYQDDVEEARVLWERSLALAAELGAELSVAQAKYNLAMLAWSLGNRQEAERLFDDVHDLSLRTKESMGVAMVQLAQGEIASHCGQYCRARRLLGESLKFLHEHQNQARLLDCLEFLAGVAIGEGKPALGVMIAASVGVRRRTDHLRRVPAVERSFQRWMAVAGVALTPAEYRQAWSAGEDLSLSEAITLAAESVAGASTSVAQVDSRSLPVAGSTMGSIPLSDREKEVVELVVEGLSRVEMSKRLFISPFTVDRYLQQIYDKLHLASRSKAELAAWAIRTGLGRS